MSAKCRTCGAPVIWAITEADQRMPVDPDPVEDGNVFLVKRRGEVRALGSRPSAEAPARVSHFTTCPDAAEHRRRVSDPDAPCRYPEHRSSDWKGEGGKQICGVCHPRPEGEA